MQNLEISPQNKGSKPRPSPGLPTVGSPLPQLRGFECKQSSGAGSVAKPGLRTPPVGPEPLRGKAGWGWGAGAAFPRAVPLTHPQLPLYQLPYAGVRTRWRAPRIRPRSMTQPPALSKARVADSQGDGEPGFAPHLHTRSSRSWIAALQRGTVRLNSDEGAGSQSQPAF